MDYAFLGTDSMGRTGSGNDIAVTLEFVPEPATLAGPLTAILGLLTVRRRRTPR